MLDFNKLYPKMLRDRQYLHKNAECGFDTPLTSRYIINTLKKIGYTPRVIGKGGIVAETKANMGPYTLLRADFDALPIFEETDLEFKSQNGNIETVFLPASPQYRWVSSSAAKEIMKYNADLAPILHEGVIKLIK